MNTTVIFLRHAHTQKDPAQNAAAWVLSDDGEKQAETFAHDPITQNIDVVISSNEEKSVLTATPVAQKLNKDILRVEGFNEVKRGDAFLSDEEFEKEKRRQLEDWDHPAQGGETGNEALERFEDGLDKVINENEGKTILIISHGTILNLYFAKIAGEKEAIFDRWKQTGFCSYGIIENGEVVKDITS